MMGSPVGVEMWVKRAGWLMIAGLVGVAMGMFVALECQVVGAGGFARGGVFRRGELECVGPDWCRSWMGGAE